MTDTLYADVSEFQPDVTNSYPYHFIAFRSNDGTYRDRHFAANIAWAKAAVKGGHISGFLVYFVWETNWKATVDTFKSMVGTPDPRMAVMIDVESWGGKIRGNQSAGINAARENLIAWLGHNRKRVIGYANAGDFANLWPSRGDARVVLANYSANPSFPNKIAHQFSDRYNVPPFGPCDVNSADGLDPVAFATALGIGPVPPPKPKPVPAPTPIPPNTRRSKMLFYQVDKASVPSGAQWPGVFIKEPGSPPEHVLDNESAIAIGQNVGVAYSVNMPKVSYAQHALWAGLAASAAAKKKLLAPHPDATIDPSA